MYHRVGWPSSTLPSGIGNRLLPRWRRLTKPATFNCSTLGQAPFVFPADGEGRLIFLERTGQDSPGRAGRLREPQLLRIWR